MVSWVSIAGMLASLVVCLALPLGGLFVLTSRRTPEGTKQWPGVARAFLAGVLCFLLSQMVTRLPLMAWLGTIDADWARALVSPAAASYSAGLFEETGRLLVMLWLLRRLHRWVDGIGFGLGHGGVEAILLVGLAQVNLLVVAALVNTAGPSALDQLPAAARDALLALLAQSPEQFWLAGVERVAAIALHVGLSLLVLWGIVAGRRLLAWLGAVLIHGTANLGAVLIVASGWPNAAVWAEVFLLVAVGAFWWFLVRRLRPGFPQAAQAA